LGDNSEKLKLPLTYGLPKAFTLLASPINKIILVVRLGPKLKMITGLRQALNVNGDGTLLLFHYY
jgi:hypothetical protein